ncbi:MAG TPA: cytochrome c1 [Methylophilaceae bacterium]|nr:cytochrome c1 [Methylophilaceae bacterium]
MNVMRNLLLSLVLTLPLAVQAAESIHLDKAPINPNNRASLQRGAKIFVNYCLNCHSAAYMRYNRLIEIGLSEEQIKNNLMLAGDKVGNTMTANMAKPDGNAWFGAAPPDLSVEARARGADWLYSYMRGFYKDESRPTGWNNIVFDKVAMPHVLWQLQGVQVLKTESQSEGHSAGAASRLTLQEQGLLSPREYNALVADLVNYMVFMSEPAKRDRLHLGIFVLLFLGLLFVLTYFLKKEFWKDVE